MFLSDVSLQSEDHWENDQRIPFFEKGRQERYTVQDAVNIISNESKVSRKCSRQPLRVRENASFIIDLRCFKDWEDIKADLNGVYNGVIRCGISTIEYEDGTCRQLTRKEVPLETDHGYHLLQNIKRNKAAPELVRSIFLLRSKEKEFVENVCLLQYNLTNAVGCVEVEVKSHGNCKAASKTPYYPTKKSTMKEMKAALNSNEAPCVYNDMRRVEGGVCAARNPSDLPRSKNQIYQAKAREVKNVSADDVQSLLKYARDDEDLVLHHSDFPEDLWILGTKAMCSDVGRFTFSEMLSSPISVDPTFNIGKFEVTPVVYKNLLLTSKRTNVNPIFLGPTMIHHNKKCETYRTLAATCVSKCPGFVKAKGFITDGEEELQNAFKQELKSAKALRCFKHFERNCIEKLRAIGIREKRDHSYFIGKTFGIPGKCEGILDAEGRHDLRRRLDDVKVEMNTKEKELLKKNSTSSYVPRFWAYLDDHYDMMRNCMISKVRGKAGMMIGNDGKYLRSYTNTSESMNKIMKTARDAFLRKNPCFSHLNKMQFTKHVFQAIHNDEREEFKSAVAGVSDLYDLSKEASYLQIPTDIWFTWTPEMREKYINQVDRLTMGEILQQKDVQWPEMEDPKVIEFKDTQVRLAKALHDNFGYSQENADILQKEVLGLMNHPHAVQRKASLEISGNKRFEVASRSAKGGTVQVTSFSDHATCVCGRYRNDGICKHSLAVASLQHQLASHLDFIRKKFKGKESHTSLAEYNVNKVTAGKKGARNKVPFRASRGDASKSTSNSSEKNDLTKQPFTEIYHNDNQFVLQFLTEGAKSCKSCGLSFCHRKRVIPFDVILSHKERWHYPLNGDWSEKRASKVETTRYYHPSSKCLLSRFPYFDVSFVEIPLHVLPQLLESHKKYLSSELGINFDRL